MYKAKCDYANLFITSALWVAEKEQFLGFTDCQLTSGFSECGSMFCPVAEVCECCLGRQNGSYKAIKVGCWASSRNQNGGGGLWASDKPGGGVTLASLRGECLCPEGRGAFFGRLRQCGSV